MPCKMAFLKISQKITRKDLFQSLRPKACNFFKKETLAHVFSFEFYEIFKNTFFHGTPPVAASISLPNNLQSFANKIQTYLYQQRRGRNIA